MSDPIQVNYPKTTLHLTDTTSSDLSATGLLLFDGSSNIITQVSQSSIQINAANPTNGKNLLGPTSHAISSGDVVGSGAASRTLVGTTSLEFQTFTDGVQNASTVLSKNRLISDVPVFDVSLNALKLGGVASTTGQVITANADGKPVWSTLPTEVIPTLSQVLVAGNSANTTALNMNYNDLQHASEITLAADNTSSTANISPDGFTFYNGVDTGVAFELLKTDSSGSSLTLNGGTGNQVSLTCTAGTLIGLDITETNKPTTRLTAGKLTIDGDFGTTGQVLTSDGTVMSWQDPALNCGLSDVLTNDSDASNNPITNLSSVSFVKVQGGAVGDSALQLKGVNPDPSTYTTDLLHINTPANVTRATKQFSGNYLPLSIGGTVYWVQLFSAPPV